MFRDTDHLQFDVAAEKPDPVYAHKLQELIGGTFGEMTVTMQYSCRAGTAASRASTRTSSWTSPPRRSVTSR